MKKWGDYMLDNIVDNLKDDIIKATQELIRIPSVYSKSDDEKMPFGKNVNSALEYMLDLGKKLGFRTKNIDGYCGYIEFGKGDELVGIIGHLDVVPEGTGWTFPPFSATISDGKIFGRGAIDDKGPVVASLYAMKAVMDNCKLNKRVRLIIGLNEENDWKCIDYYKKHEEAPAVGFSPDADFPCIYAEKSILSCYIKENYTNNFDKIKIKEIDCNNNALNVVPKFCSLVLEINDNIQMSDFIETLKHFIKRNNFEIDIYKLSQTEVKLTSYGVGAHAAHPDAGVNAISRLLVILALTFKHYNCNLELLDFFNKYINTEYDGKSLGISCKDESGRLTLNVGDFLLENNILKIGMNLRIPINTPISDIEDIFNRLCSNYSNLNFETTSTEDFLHVPKNDKLVKTLCKIFNEETNSNAEPIAIGGATYARAFTNCISFGPNFPGHKDMCHQTDEFVEIDNLILACKIYAKAIIELGK